jgi:hypothetical protein
LLPPGPVGKIAHEFPYLLAGISADILSGSKGKCLKFEVSEVPKVKSA